MNSTKSYEARCVAFGAVFVTLLASPLSAASPVPPPQSQIATVAIFYDGPDLPLAEGYLGAHYVMNLLGHFGLRGELIRLEDYKPGRLGNYTAGFYLGTAAKTIPPAGFLKDVSSYDRPFCWLGQHIDKLVGTASSRFGFRFVGYQGDRTSWRVDYKGVLFPRDNFNLTIVEPIQGGRAMVRATALQSDNTRRAYVLRRDRFWYFADTPFGGAQEGNRYLVFCDLLHEILEIDHASASRALARMEDVSADADPDDLRAVADVLSKYHVPFQIATIPLYRDPWNHVEMRLSDRPKVVDGIHYMIDHGGTPVMHGWSHQYHSATGDDYEFWDEIKNSVIANDSEEEVVRRLDAGLVELFNNSIFPVAFETPHYAASLADYRGMQHSFRMFYERTMPTPNLSSIQYFPYPVIDEFGRYVVPENLGYIPKERPDPKAIIENARCMRVVRDGVPSFYFHPFMDPQLLDETIRGMLNLGYHFVSLREFGGTVDDGGRYLVRTESGSVNVRPQNELWRLRRFDASGKLLSEQIAAAPSAQPVTIDVDVPAGGWAALDCFKKASTVERLTTARERLLTWWKARSARTNRQAANTTFDEPGGAWIVGLAQPSVPDSNDQESYRDVLEMFGFSTKSMTQDALSSMPDDKRTILVVTDGAARLLTATQQQQILRYLSSGGAVVAEGDQTWLTALGMQRTGWRLPVTEVQERLVEGSSFSWEPEELIDRYSPPPGSTPLSVETDTKQPVALAGQYGSGRYLYLSAPLDPHTRYGVSHYPYFAEYLAEAFHVRSALRGGRIETYFDPGYRGGVNPDNLADFWKRSGIKTVYVAAWQFYDRYSFNYASLIRAAHRNGVAVYAWFMFPQVTPLFWQQHPECRERAVGGIDGRPGWRYLMNFENAGCFSTAMDWATSLLQSQPWDGVNIAELNFDAEYPDYLRADRFVPMNDEVRADFAKNAGFDPSQLFVPGSPYYHERNPEALAKFLRYRQDIVINWHRRVLTALGPVVRKNGHEVIVTAMDSLHSAYVQPALGVDSRRIVALMKEFDFTLQVEDPVEHWAESPDRYTRFAATYSKLIPDQKRLMFDINVVSDREIEHTSLPSTIARGTELARTAMSAAVSGRVAIYAEHTVGVQDWPLIGAALARPGRLGRSTAGYQLETPRSVFMNVPPDRGRDVDGRSWPVVAPNGLFVPPGRHEISASAWWSKVFGSKLDEIQSLSADLLGASGDSTGLSLRYTSPGRAPVVLNRRPIEIAIDHQTVDVPVEGHGDEWVFILPRGEHTARVTTLTRAGLAVNSWSRISSSIIAVLSVAAIGLMVLLYIRLQWHATVTSGETAR